MEPIIILYLKYKFLCNPLLKDKYCFEIKRKLKMYFKYNFSSTYFIRFTPREQTLYERRDILNDTANTSNIDDISSNNSTTNVSLLDSDSEDEEEQIFPNPTPPPNNIFTYRRRPTHRRRRAIFIPPIDGNSTYDQLLESLSINNINSSAITSLNNTSSNILPSLTENTIITNDNPFEPRRELPRSPDNQNRNTSDTIRRRFSLF